MYGMGLVVILILMGGSIAYLGDAVGMWVGRKRLSLFGMRPKHSSIIITVVTGMTIAGMSLAVLSAASSDVRTALFRLKEIEGTLAQTHEALLATEDELGLLKAVLERQRRTVAELAAARDRAVAERDAALEELQALEAEAEAVQAELERARAELEAWKSRVATLQELADSLEATVLKLEASDSKLRRDLAALSEHYVLLENRLRSGAFAFLRGEVVAGMVIRTSSREELEGAFSALLEKAREAARLRGVARDESDRPAVALAEGHSTARAVEEVAAKPGTWVARVVALHNTVQGEPLTVGLELIPETVIYRAGEVIAERLLPGGRPHPEAQILSLIDEVKKGAVAKGMVAEGEGAGSVSGDEFADALIELRRIQGPARLLAVAAKETRNTDSEWEIRLVVESASEAGGAT